MKNADKNRDPQKAVKRAASDARCALKKLLHATVDADLANALTHALNTVNAADSAIKRGELKDKEAA